MTRQRALVLMVISLLVAAALRLPALDHIPPGPHYDEAANGILAGEIGLDGARPVFISSYTGKEVLFFYVAGALMRGLGPSLFTLRLAAAYFGLLTVATIYWLGRALLADRRVAVFAAALLAVSFWHLLFSRLGFRAISQPLLQALAVAALFRGLQRPRWHWFVLAGLFLGLTAYTYLAARLFPIPLLLALVPVLAAGRQRLGQLSVVALVAALVVAPLLLYFVRHPDAFWVRIDQVAPETSLGTGESYVRSLGMFFLAGDPYWRFNIPGKPLFDWLWGGLGVAGWISLFWRWRRWWYDWQKASVILLMVVPFLMILPTALASGEIVPSNLRAIGLLPFVFFLPALGLLLLLEQIAVLLRRPLLPVGQLLRRLSLFDGYEYNLTFLALLILLTVGAGTARVYFQEWAGRDDLFYDSDVDLAAVARWLDDEAPAADHLFVAAAHYRHPTVAFLSDQYERIRWLPGSQALPLPASGSSLYVFPHSSPAPEWAAVYLDGAEQLPGATGPDGRPLFVAYRLERAPEPALSQPQAINFGNAVRLLGAEPGPGMSGQTLPVTLYWQAQSTPDSALRPFIHLLDAWGVRWGQLEPDAFPAEQWRAGEAVVQRVDVPLPDGLPPGDYTLRVGLFDPASGARLPQLDEAGRYAGDSFFVGGAHVLTGAPPPEPPAAPQGTAQEVRPGLTLLGYERDDARLATGDTLPLSLWWWATQVQPALRSRLEIYDTAAAAAAPGRLLTTAAPVHNTYPFPRWTTPVFVIDRLDPRLPFNLESGTYRLQLRLLDDADRTVHVQDLGVVTVEATERLFTPPAVTHPLDATFGGELALLGYNQEPTATDVLALDLVWQAVEQPSASYHVFVHLLHPDGTCCAWQSDALPRQGGYPTDRWQPGEVVVDRYEIPLAGLKAGRYPLEVGFFILENGRRLQTVVPGLPDDDAVDLQPVEIP
jgi:4-amino-4-deoxy-L-arabinose transferase-like glycosyltransferase